MFNLIGGAQKKFSNIFEHIIPKPDEESENKDSEKYEASEINQTNSSNPSAFFSEAFSNYARIASENLALAQKNASKLTNLVKENLDNTILGELNRAQKSFQEEVSSNKGVNMPWNDLLLTDENVKKQILSLSEDESNFLQDSPVIEEDLTVKILEEMAKVFVEYDPRTLQIRYELVPKKLTEEKFWRNYFYRVSLVCKAAEKTVEERKKEDEPNVTEASDMPTPEAPENGIGEDDWEHDFLQDMPDYEVVKDGKSDEQWNEELDELLEDCSDGKSSDERNKSV